MEKLIADLLALDRRGRDLVSDAEQRRERAAEEIRGRAESIKDALGHRADAHLERTRSEHNRTVEERLSLVESEYRTRLDKMETLYSQSRDRWVDTLVNRCLKK